jgi:tetratricopeptide (TPR) repeat protein
MNSTYDLARSYVEKAMYDEALSLYKSFVLDFPNASYLLDVKLSIADLYYKKWDYTKAELEYTKILAENEKVRFSKPNYIVDFSCYVKRPLHEHGTFVIESLWNGTRSVTDAYLYNSIEYICDKAENIITARVQGSQSYILQ